VVVPDGHDEHHGHGEGLVELVEAADVGEAVVVAEGLELVRAELGRDGGAVLGDAVEGRGRDLDLLATLDDELGDLVGLEAGDDAVFIHP